MMNRTFIEKLIRSLIVLSVFVSTFVCARDTSTHFHDKLLDARESFQNVYYELIKKGYFDNLYNNNLIFSTDFDSDFPRNGAILLTLTEWLENNKDSESQFLLKKLNKFFGLQFHRFICKIDVPKPELGAVSNSYHALYGHKVSDSDPMLEYHPFRTTLSKAMIFLLMTEFSDKNYQQKKESIVYFMEGVRKRLINVNNGLSKEMRISEDHFDEFINHIEVYSLREPLMKPTNIKMIIFFIALGLAVTALVVYVVFYVIPNSDNLWAGIKRQLGQFAEAIGQKVTAGAITEITSPERQITTHIQQEATGLINVAVATGSEAMRQPLGQVLVQIGQLRQELNQNMMNLVNQVNQNMTNLVNQVDQRINQIPLNLVNHQANVQQPNNNQQLQVPVNNNPVQQIGQQMGNGLGAGVIQGVRQEIFNSLPRVVTGPYNYFFGGNQPQEQQQNPGQQPNVNNNIHQNDPPRIQVMEDNVN